MELLRLVIIDIINQADQVLFKQFYFRPVGLYFQEGFIKGYSGLESVQFHDVDLISTKLHIKVEIIHNLVNYFILKLLYSQIDQLFFSNSCKGSFNRTFSLNPVFCWVIIPNAVHYPFTTDPMPTLYWV